MSSALNDLRRWLRASPQPSASVDWTSIEAELGTALPLDYREFVDRFGGCRIQHLDICAPGGKRELSDGRAIVEGYFRFGLAEYRDAPGWPDHGKLLLWGDMDSDRLLCWDRGSADDPDEWRSVVFDTVGTLVRLEGNMTTCIRDIITGRQRPAILGRDFDKSKLWIDVDEGTYPIQLD